MNRLNTFSFSDNVSLCIGNRPSIKKITYAYDSMNRRVARTDENGTTQYLYGNPNHPFQLTAVCSPSGSLSRYHYDDFGLLFALERDNNWYYITTDQLGTPRVVCDANGEVVKVLEYDSFGQVIADSNPEFELHISFAGGLIDVDTELVRFGFRDYDAVAGKWTAKDPMGFAGGDGNLYGYVVNEPVNLTDPSGLDPNQQWKTVPSPQNLGLPPLSHKNLSLPSPPTGGGSQSIPSRGNLPKCGQDRVSVNPFTWVEQMYKTSSSYWQNQSPQARRAYEKWAQHIYKNGRKFVGIGLIGGTLIEDIATGGAGIADDPLTIMAGAALLKGGD